MTMFPVFHVDESWGERAEFVLDRTLRWAKKRVEAKDAIRFQGPTGVWLQSVTDTDADTPPRARAFPSADAARGSVMSGPELVRAGWNHEHCAICWQTLGLGGQLEAYVNDNGTWVCEQCYVGFVERRSLEFIPGA